MSTIICVFLGLLQSGTSFQALETLSPTYIIFYSINQYRLVETKCIFNITASSLKCYEGYKGNMPGHTEVNFKETSCSPLADVCFKESFKTADGYFATVKSCHTSLAPEFLALRIKPDDCMVGFEDYCRRKTGLSRQAIARENKITNMISRSGARDFLAQQCKKLVHLPQIREMNCQHAFAPRISATPHQP